MSLNPAISRSGGGSDLRSPIRRKWSFAQLAMQNPTFLIECDFFLSNNYKNCVFMEFIWKLGKIFVLLGHKFIFDLRQSGFTHFFQSSESCFYERHCGHRSQVQCVWPLRYCNFLVTPSSPFFFVTSRSRFLENKGWFNFRLFNVFWQAKIIKNIFNKLSKIMKNLCKIAKILLILRKNVKIGQI